MKNPETSTSEYIDSRMLDWHMLSIKDIAFYAGKEIRSVQRKSGRQNWPYLKELTRRGKPAHYYPLDTLPPDIQVSWAMWSKERFQEAVEKEKQKKNGMPQSVPGPTTWYHAKEALSWTEQKSYYEVVVSQEYQRGPKQKVYDGVSRGLCSAARYILVKRFPELQNTPEPESLFNDIKQKAHSLDETDISHADSALAKGQGKINEKVKKDLFVPLQTKRNFEEVANQIKELIFSGKLQPSEVLPPERQLAAQFNASRNTVREAYRVLEGTGFIELRKGNTGGARIRKLDGSLITQSLYDLVQFENISITDITQARLTIELAILDSAFENMGSKEISEIETCLANASSNLRNTPSNKESDRSHITQFHLLIAKNSHNKIYYYILSSLIDLSIQFLVRYTHRLSGEKEHLRDHWEILEALKSGDVQESKTLFRKHIMRMHDDISSQINS